MYSFDNMKDIKPDNIMIHFPFGNSYIDEIVSKEPPEYYPSQNVAGTDVHLLVSQPISLPMSLGDNDITLKLADFGHGRWIFSYDFPFS